VSEPRNNATKTRGKPFGPGNPGRPKGARHHITRAVEELLDGQAEKLTQKAIDLAIGGDLTALRLCLDRIAPPRKDRTVEFDMPTISGAEDHPTALISILTAVAGGNLTPQEGIALAGVLAEHRTAIETTDHAARIAALEQRLAR